MRAVHQIDLHEAKLHFTDLIEAVLKGDEIVITEDNQPVLKLVRVSEAKPRRKAGSARGLIMMARDFDAPLEEFRPYME